MSTMTPTQNQPADTPVDPDAIRVFIAEDHRITLWGLERLIEASAPRMRVVGVATTLGELLSHPDLPQADILLLDLDLGEDNTVPVLPTLQRLCPKGRVLVLTGDTDAHRHREAVVLGARGVLHKGQSAATLVTAIDKVHGGEVWLERSLLGQVLGLLTGTANRAMTSEDPHARRIASLTPREREVIHALMANAGAKQLVLAERLNMSEHTLRNHLTTIYSKLGVRGRLELHVFATENGLVPGEGRSSG
ncbi:response regulator transcription factor [Leptothrix sp. BB-4]